MERWQREWSGDWNGRGEPLAEAIKAAQRNGTWEGSRFEADPLWNRHGLRAKYTELEEARERLGYSAPRDGRHSAPFALGDDVGEWMADLFR